MPSSTQQLYSETASNNAVNQYLDAFGKCSSQCNKTCMGRANIGTKTISLLYSSCVPRLSVSNRWSD
eukprot:5583273-Ditylum_brightwellii.AAC.1